MIKTTLVGGRELVGQWRSKQAQMQAQMARVMNTLIVKLTRKIKEEKLSGQVLKNRTGTLRRSITPSISTSSNLIEGKASTNIIYAAIHEYGGVTRPHVIVPKHRLALAWVRGSFIGPIRMATATGRFSKKQSAYPFIFARRVNHPGSHIPERSFMRSSLREMKPEILESFRNAILSVVRER